MSDPDHLKVSFPWGYALSWQEGESPIAWQKGVVDPSDEAAGKGILLLTNKRLLFLTKSGLLSDYSIHDAFDLEGVVSVSPYRSREGMLGVFQDRYIRVSFSSGSLREFSRTGIHDLVLQINQAIAARKQEVPAGRPSGQDVGEFDLQSGRSLTSPVIIEKEVRVVVKVKCRYCGLLNEQLSSRCESCGAPLE